MKLRMGIEEKAVKDIPAIMKAATAELIYCTLNKGVQLVTKGQLP